MNIEIVTSPEDFSSAVTLFKSYEKWAQACPCFEGFEKELDEIDKRYSLPYGRLWLVKSSDGKAIGVVGVQFKEGACCELKRLWIEPQGRGHHTGQALIMTVLDFAKEQKAHSILLETVRGQMDHAIALYENLGFRQTEYDENSNILKMAYTF
ncbi:GNAT family N-acetyltransferase [Kiloniella sp. EL199]|uniref:GNAT family N-acetyltransferase n=1 Tax=Kiloniella sp. EL199 TaxID=2107581 RepID=UPI000EA3751B|nr:GNAT family N-acetyltransferase [Kiloniella sp. EL199]